MIAPNEPLGGRPEQDPAPRPPKIPAKIDTCNKFLVGAANEAIAIINPPLPRQVISRAEAVNLAAWLVVIADPECKEFNRVLAEIKNT